MKRFLKWIASALTVMWLQAAAVGLAVTVDADQWPIRRDGWYSTMGEVAVYLASYGELPENYITKREAQRLGWDSALGNLWDVAKGVSIGGDRFGNYEGNVPDACGRIWKECDIDYNGGYRGGKRIVFSNDGLIYYSSDHYASFEEVDVVFGGAARETATPSQKAKLVAGTEIVPR